MRQGIVQRGLGALDRAISTAILFREAARTSRRWQTFAARTGFSAALIGVLLLGIHGAVTATSSSLVDSADLAWLGKGLFTAFSVAQLGLAILLAPLMTATAVIEEAEEGTLDLLVLTRLDSGQIIAGKVVSRLLVLTTVVLGALPITTLVVNLGGVSGLEVLAVTTHTLTTVGIMGLLGAFFALFTRSPMLCVMASASYAVPFFLVLPGAYAIGVADPSSMAHFSPFAASMAQDVTALITPASYLPAMVVVWGLLRPLFQLKTARAGIDHAFDHGVWRTFTWLKALGVWLVLGLTLGLALPLLYARAAGGIATGGVVSWLARAWVWAYASAGFALATWAYLRIAFDVVDGLDSLFSPKRSSDDRAPIDMGTNPVWWREARLGAWLRTAAPILSTWLLVALGVLQTGWWLFPGGILLMAVGNAAVALGLAAWMGTRTIADERRRASLEPLLTTTMANHRILSAKAAGVAFATFPLLLLTLPLLVVGVPHLRMWDLMSGGQADFARSTVHAGFTWAWLVAVWSAVVVGSLVAGLRVRNPRSAFGVTLAAVGVGLLLPSAMGRLFPDVVWLAVPARLWAPPLAGGAGLVSYVVSMLGWSTLAAATYVVLTRRLRRWALAVLTALLCLSIAPAPARAQTVDVKKEMERINQLQMRIEPLVDGLHRRDGWTALTVVLQNTGAGTSGTLTLTEESAYAARSWSRQVDLAEGARKEISLVFQATGHGGDRRVTFVTSEGRSAIGQVRLQPLEAADVLIGVVGTDAMGLPAAVRDATNRAVPGRRPRGQAQGPRVVRTGLLPPATIPTASHALSGIDWIVWPDADPSQLSTPQAEALVAWVSDGGHLLLTVSDTHRQVMGSPLAALVAGTLGAPLEGDVDELAARLGVPGAPTPVAPFVADREVWVGARDRQGQPTWAVWPHGLGSVSLLPASLALDPLDDVDREVLWRELLFLPAPGAIVDGPDDGLLAAHNHYPPFTWSPIGFDQTDPDADWESQIRGRLDDIPGVSPLPMSWLVAFAGLYLLVIGPLDYFVLRAIGRQPLTWITFPLAIAAFTGLAILGTRYTKGSTAILTRIELVDVLPDAGRWRGDTFFGVFSTRKVDLTVRSGFDDAVLAPLDEPGFLPDPRLAAGNGPGQLAYRAETWTLAYARSTWSTPREEQMAVGPLEEGITLRNDLGVDLDEAYVLSPSGSWPSMRSLGPMRAGETVELPLRYSGWSPLPHADAGDEASWRLHVLHRPPMRDHGDLAPDEQGMLFIGWAEGHAVEPLTLDGLSPVEEPIVVFRQALPTTFRPPPLPEGSHVALVLRPPLDSSTRVQMACEGQTYNGLVSDGEALFPHASTPRGTCQISFMGGSNVWFTTLEAPRGRYRCELDEVDVAQCEEHQP